MSYSIRIKGKEDKSYQWLNSRRSRDWTRFHKTTQVIPTNTLVPPRYPSCSPPLRFIIREQKQNCCKDDEKVEAETNKICRNVARCAEDFAGKRNKI